MSSLCEGSNEPPGSLKAKASPSFEATTATSARCVLLASRDKHRQVVQLHPHTAEHIPVNTSYSRTDPILQVIKNNWQGWYINLIFNKPSLEKKSQGVKSGDSGGQRMRHRSLLEAHPTQR
ncbi:hypothetical protein ANN_10470 [Periplaneta americana]|uniref:Uncharacterized protein n=1 Tax=Periplaneta americana TaxID=6978 RepID=A0ABQ8TPF5_PERAM|nr:hypothetical protein ANN_10470 [Periplaneta americana]